MDGILKLGIGFRSKDDKIAPDNSKEGSRLGDPEALIVHSFSRFMPRWETHVFIHHEKLALGQGLNLAAI